MKITRFITAAAAVAAAALALSACSGGTGTPSGDSSGGGTAPLLTLGQFSEPSSFDPSAAQEGNNMPYYQAVYDTLIKRAPDGTLQPFLATEWNYDEALTSLTLTLRDDVTFTDGAKFDADAAKANIEHFMQANGPSANQAADIASVEATDPTTLVIDLSQPDPSLEQSLSGALGLMASPEALGSDSLASAPVGSGPYTLQNSLVGSEYTFVRNPDYWGDKLPYDSIKFLVLTDETARINALRSGQINAGVFTNPTSASELESANMQVLTQTLDWTGFVYFDRTGSMNPAFADQRVRRAITLSIDKKAILDTISAGRGELTDQIFPTTSAGYLADYDENDEFAYNPDKARELLAEAGYANGFTLNMPISPVFPPALYTTIQQNLADVGITMTRTEFGPGQTIPALLGGKHEITYFTLAMFNDWTTVRQYIAPDAAWNPFKTSDPELTKLIGELQNAKTDDERTTSAQGINQWVIDNDWFGPFARSYATYAADQTVKVELQTQQVVPSIYNYSPAQ